MPDGVHAAMELVQAPTLQKVPDRVAPEPQLGELAARDDAVLARRECRHRDARVRRREFDRIIRLKSRPFAHIVHRRPEV